MPKELVLPEIAESVVEGEIVRWYVAEGEWVEKDQPFVEVMTDKVTVELPSPCRGRLIKHLAKEGEIVAVHRPIALLEEVEEAVVQDRRSAADALRATSDAAANVGGGGEPAADGMADGKELIAAKVAVERKPEARSAALGVEPGSGGTAGSLGATAPNAGAPSGRQVRIASETSSKNGEDPGERLSLFRADSSAETIRNPFLAGVAGAHRDAAMPRQGGALSTAPSFAAGLPAARKPALPAARRWAEELGIDLAEVPGSGPGGRVRVEDVKAYAAQRQAPSAAALSPAAFPAELQPLAYPSPKGYAERERRVPLAGLRRAIAQQMLRSHWHTVRTLTVHEADFTELVALRQRLKPEAEAQGVKLTYLPFVLKAAVVALKKFPSLNTSLDETTHEVVFKDYYHLGVAVATDAGLVVPVVRDVDDKSVLAIAAEIDDLASRARTGKLRPEEVSGSTFTVTNIGAAGSLMSFPIINVPEAAILGMHALQKRPVVQEDDAIVVRQMMYLSLSFDHRLVDGLEAARFCQQVIRLLERPERLLLEGV